MSKDHYISSEATTNSSSSSFCEIKSSPNSDVEIEGRRPRSSSMDILADAVCSSSYSHDSQPHSYSAVTNNTPFSPAGDLIATSNNNNSTDFDNILISSPPRYTRPRGATFSYSPYERKDPEHAYLKQSTGLSWLANIADDEATINNNTAELLSGLISNQIINDRHLPSTMAGDLLSSSSSRMVTRKRGHSDSNTTHDDDDNADVSSDDLTKDISLLTAVASKMIHDHIDDSLLLGSITNGRHRSNSMPSMPSNLDPSRYTTTRPRTNSITKEYLVKHGFSSSGVGAYTPEERKIRIERFLEKRRNRVWTKRVKYDVRKNFADSRIRVKGRFIRKSEEEVLNGLATMHQEKVK